MQEQEGDGEQAGDGEAAGGECDAALEHGGEGEGVATEASCEAEAAGEAGAEQSTESSTEESDGGEPGEDESTESSTEEFDSGEAGEDQPTESSTEESDGGEAGAEQSPESSTEEAEGGEGSEDAASEPSSAEEEGGETSEGASGESSLTQEEDGETSEGAPSESPSMEEEGGETSEGAASEPSSAEEEGGETSEGASGESSSMEEEGGEGEAADDPPAADHEFSQNSLVYLLWSVARVAEDKLRAWRMTAERAIQQQLITDDEFAKMLRLQSLVVFPRSQLSSEERAERAELERWFQGNQRVLAIKGEIEDDLGGQGPAGWHFLGIVGNATFLGRPIEASGGSVSGVYVTLYSKLREIEQDLMQQLGCDDPSQVGDQLNIYSIVGVRPPKAATGGTHVSMHSFGLAIDINYRGNPFIQARKNRSEEVAEQIIRRATRLVLGDEIPVTHGALEEVGSQWDRLKRASEALKSYFTLDDPNNSRRLTTLNQRHDMNISADLVAEDRQRFSGCTDFRNHGDVCTNGIMDLPKELVVTCVQHGLLWGGSYQDGKDLMHFDYRHPDPRHG